MGINKFYNLAYVVCRVLEFDDTRLRRRATE